MNSEIIKKFCDLLGEERVFTGEAMSRHTTFKIGGPADYFLMPDKDTDVGRIVKICKESAIPYFILGNGSNLLVGDGGYRGAVIQIYKNMSAVTVEGTEITVQAGALLSSVAAAAKNAALTGFEFAGGIPGTMGGAVVMNAGAYGGEMKDVLTEVTVMDEEGEIVTLPADKLELGYRTSIIKTAGYIVLEAKLQLKEGNPEVIRETMKDLTIRRTTKQPLEYPSAGSTFKRPEGYFAGKLIEDAGLKGYSVGGAQVSEKHAGFVINRENASPEEIRDLIEAVRTRVFETSGVRLEPEVKLLGFGPSAWGDTASADSKRSN